MLALLFRLSDRLHLIVDRSFAVDRCHVVQASALVDHLDSDVSIHSNQCFTLCQPTTILIPAELRPITVSIDEKEPLHQW